MDWNDFLSTRIAVYCNDVESSSVEPHADFLHSIIITKMCQFPGTLAFSRDSYFSTEQRTRFCIPTYKLLKLCRFLSYWKTGFTSHIIGFQDFRPRTPYLLVITTGLNLHNVNYIKRGIISLVHT